MLLAQCAAWHALCMRAHRVDADSCTGDATASERWTFAEHRTALACRLGLALARPAARAPAHTGDGERLTERAVLRVLVAQLPVHAKHSRSDLAYHLGAVLRQASDGLMKLWVCVRPGYWVQPQPRTLSCCCLSTESTGKDTLTAESSKDKEISQPPENCPNREPVGAESCCAPCAPSISPQSSSDGS